MSHHSRSLDLHARNRVGAGESAPGTSASASTSNTQRTTGEDQNLTSSLQEQARRRNRIYSSYDSLDNFADNFIKETTPDGEISVVLQENNQDERGGESSGAQQETSFGRSESEQEKGTKDNNELDNGDAEIGQSIDIQAGESGNLDHNEPEMPGPSRASTLPTPGNNPAPDAPGPVEQEVRIVPPNNGNNVLLQIDDVEQQAPDPDDAQPEGHLERYLHLMNSLGVSWYRRVEYAVLSKRRSIIIKTILCTFTLFAFMETFRNIKVEGMDVARLKKLKNCVGFGYVLIDWLGRACFIYLMCFCAHKVSEMLRHLRTIEAYDNTPPNLRKFAWLPVAMTTASLFNTTVTSIFSYSSFNDWSFKDALLTRSFYMGQTVFVWSTTNYTNVTEAMFDEYHNSGYTATGVFFGLSDGTLEFCQILQGDIIRDVLLLSPLILLSGWAWFERRIQPQILAHPNNADPAEVEACLRQYMDMRRANAVVNSTLGMVHKLMMMQNLFLYSYLFVLIISLDDDMDMTIIKTTIEALKATASLIISSKIHRTNSSAIKWLSLLSTYDGPVDVKGILGMTVEVALAELRGEPIGFGTDYFLINESFMVGFFAALTSIITILVDQEAK